ncbi:MAG: hypothetical protein Q4E03_00605 [Trueperella sp.]|nr:hypothetical protein [Trueperella sp.]
MGTTASYVLRSAAQYTRAIIFLLLIGVLLAITFFDPAISRKWAVALIAGGAALVWYVALLRPRLLLDQAGLHIRNSFTDRFIPWSSYRDIQLHLGFRILSADDAGAHSDRVAAFPASGGFSFARENYFGQSTAKPIPARSSGKYRTTATAPTASGLIRRLAETAAATDPAPPATRTVRIAIPTLALTAFGIAAQLAGLWLTLS